MSEKSASSNLTRNEQLVQACLDLDLLSIESLLNEGADPNFLTMRSKYEEYISIDRAYAKAPLDIIASHYRTDLNVTMAAKLLLDKGANINGGTSDADFSAPIHTAADSNNLHLTQLLIERGADVNLRDNEGLDYTPLHIASGGYGASSSQELIAFLINSGADVNALSNRGETPAHLIAKYPAISFNTDKLLSTLKELSYYGADFSIVDHEQNSAWSLMQNRSDLKTAVLDGFLESGFNTNNPLTEQFTSLLSNFGLTSLEELTLPENKAIAMNILDQNIQTHLMTIYPENLLEHQLIQASFDLDLDQMISLLDQGADPNFVSAREHHFQTELTPLMFVMNNHYTSTPDNVLASIKALLDHGADPNISSGEGKSPLHALAQMSYYSPAIQSEAFNYLIKHGADVNLQNNEGQTPAHVALDRWGSIHVLTNLAKAGADFNIENTKHQTVLQLIEDNTEAQQALKNILKPKASIVLNLEDIIHIDTQDSLFQEPSNIQTNAVIHDKPVCAPQAGYISPFILQWLGFENACETEQIL